MRATYLVKDRQQVGVVVVRPGEVDGGLGVLELKGRRGRRTVVSEE